MNVNKKILEGIGLDIKNNLILIWNLDLDLGSKIILKLFKTARLGISSTLIRP